MSDCPLVSVVMPVFNGEKYLKTAVYSILNQSYQDFEFIVVDDCSTDGTSKILQGFDDPRIKILTSTTNLKTTKSLNLGITEATGKYIVRMDADDWAYPTRLQTQVDYMENHSDTVLCGSNIDICDSELRLDYVRTYPQTDSEIKAKWFRYNPFAHPATIWKRASVIEAGFYNPNIPLSQDYDLIFRITYA
jgi:glycosyltransferase involved in cell wall biosynthesis